jgi:hypothetical protein
MAWAAAGGGRAGCGADVCCGAAAVSGGVAGGVSGAVRGAGAFAIRPDARIQNTNFGSAAAFAWAHSRTVPSIAAEI